MSLWHNLPSSLRSFLLQQPLPDSWIAALRQIDHSAKMDHERQDKENLHIEEPKAGTESKEYQPITFQWKRSYDNALVLVILVVSAIILYLIMR